MCFYIGININFVKKVFIIFHVITETKKMRRVNLIVLVLICSLRLKNIVENILRSDFLSGIEKSDI